MSATTRRKRIFVAAVGGLYAVDPATGTVANRISIAGHPESFQMETSGSRVYANLPGASKIIAADRSSWAAGDQWSTGSCGANYPMVLDEAAARLFIGCRRPASVIVVDDHSGAILATASTIGDTDDMFYDEQRRLLYVIGGEGAVDVLSRAADALRSVGRIPTRAGARTGLWVASQKRLYVAVPARGGQVAEIRFLDAAAEQ